MYNRSKLIDTTGIPSSLNSGNIAQSFSKDRLDTEDHKKISDDDKDQLHDIECDIDFLGTKIQCKNKYDKAGVAVLDQIIEKFNFPKDGQEEFKLFLLAP